MKYLIAGLGNIGEEYQHTRHNIGFDILDAFAEASNIVFATKRYGDVAECKLKGRSLILLKPSTFMNLSGNAVRYWLQAEKIPVENLLVVVDDIALPFGQLRLRPGGSNAGHNGLGNIQETLNAVIAQDQASALPSYTPMNLNKMKETLPQLAFASQIKPSTD